MFNPKAVELENVITINDRKFTLSDEDTAKVYELVVKLVVKSLKPEAPKTEYKQCTPSEDAEVVFHAEYTAKDGKTGDNCKIVKLSDSVYRLYILAKGDFHERIKGYAKDHKFKFAGNHKDRQYFWDGNKSALDSFVKGWDKFAAKELKASK